MGDKTIRELQTTLPWTIRYSRDYRAAPTTHKDFTHALLHVGKAAGKLMALADDMDHDREVADDPTLRERHAKYLADLVVCALRASNVFPGGVIDLQAAVQERIATKNAPSGGERDRWRGVVELIAQGPCRCGRQTDPPTPPDCESCYARDALAEGSEG